MASVPRSRWRVIIVTRTSLPWTACRPQRFLTEMSEHVKRKLQEEIDVLEHELNHELPAELKKAVAMGDLSENAEYHMAKQSRRRDHGGHAGRYARIGGPETDHHARRRDGNTSMTWTSAVGKYCGVLLYKIVDGLALTRISPNTLTFVGLVINVVGALFFGFASSDNNQPSRFIYAGLVIIGAG